MTNGFYGQKPLPGICEENETEVATLSQVLQLLRKQNYRCALTGAMLTPENSALDHIKPISADGSNAIENLQWVTEEVNRAKGVMSQSEFVAMCQSVAFHSIGSETSGDQWW